jgi:hypothetical protein
MDCIPYPAGAKQDIGLHLAKEGMTQFINAMEHLAHLDARDLLPCPDASVQSERMDAGNSKRHKRHGRRWMV